MNTPRLITDSNGNAVWQWDSSDPFGDNIPNQSPNGTGNQFVFNLRFAGQYYDQETGTYYNGFRNYDPVTRRYLESDPIGLDGGQFSTYTYVDGNPFSYTDSQGLFVDETGVYTGATVAGTVTETSAAVAGGGIAIAGLVGVGAGLGINYGYERITGTSIGSSIYDGFHPPTQTQTSTVTKDDTPPVAAAGGAANKPPPRNFWKNLNPCKGKKTKTNGLSGKNRRYYEWDFTHGDVEVYDRNGNHLGSADPETGVMTKPAVPGRSINL